MPTIGCWVQMIPPGEAPRRTATRAARSITSSKERVSLVGPKKGAEKELAWNAHDCFFVPSWNWHHFENGSSKDPAILFSVTDRPVLEGLSLFREEAA